MFPPDENSSNSVLTPRGRTVDAAYRAKGIAKKAASGKTMDALPPTLFAGQTKKADEVDCHNGIRPRRLTRQRTPGRNRLPSA